MMDTWLFWTTVLACAAYVITVDGTTLNMYDTPTDQWYKVHSNVSLKCSWEHDSTSTVEVRWKNGTNSGLRKIIEGDENGSYAYSGGLPSPDRQIEVHNFGEDVAIGEMKHQYSELTIINITLQDSIRYQCIVEVGAGEAEQLATFEVNLYALPITTVLGDTISVDIRPPVETTSEEAFETNTTTSINGTSSNTTEEDEGDDSYDDYNDDYYASDDPSDTKKIVIICEIEGAYPEPTVSFTIGETETVEATSVTWNKRAEKEPYTGTATLELTADPKYDGKSVTCSATLPTVPETIVPSDGTSPPIEILHEVSSVTTTISPSTAITGEEVQIRCDSNGNPPPTFHVESDVAEKPSFEESADGKVFTIASVLEGDAGNYYCVATLPSRSEDDTEVKTLDSESKQHLDVQYLDEPSLDEDDAIVLSKGVSKRVTCLGRGNPSPNTVWSKGGVPLNSGNILDISQAAYSDSGEYTCESTNAAGKKTKSLNVEVEGACVGKFKTPLVSSSSSDEGSFYVKLECEVTGRPACDVDITSQPGFEITGTKKENGRILEFDAMPKLSSPVKFFCIAHNRVGRSNTSVTLDSNTEACCAEPVTAGLSTGAIIGIILLVLVILIGIPVACYFVRKRNNSPSKKAPDDAEAAEPEKEGLNKDASSEDSDTGSLPPPPADMDNDHRLNHGAHEMTTFSSN